MFDFLHRWRSVSPQTHFSAPPAFAPSLGANLTIGEIHFWPRTTQTATRRPQAQCPRETLKESGRKRSVRSLRFARATSPRVPSLTPSRARAGPGGGRKEAAERNKKAAAVGQKAPAPRNGLASPAPSRAGSRRAQARIQETAKLRSGEASASRPNASPGIARRAQAYLAVWPPPRAFKNKPSANDEVCRSSRRTLENRPNRPQRTAMRSRARGPGAPTQTTSVLRDRLRPARANRRLGEKAKRRRPAVRRSMPLALDQALASRRLRRA